METSPVLVAGMPRSGTTWTARLLATGAHAAMPGREPMNPRGRQYALGGTLDGWTRLTDPTPRQVRAMRRSYGGLNPFTFSRYGRNQHRVMSRRTRVIVKDPFAMLSLPAIHDIVEPLVVLVYRHPGAALVSYQRMGWTPDLDELRHALGGEWDQLSARHAALADWPADGEVAPPVAMGFFWIALHAMAMHDVATTRAGNVTIVAHADLSVGGLQAAGKLMDRLGLVPTTETSAEFGTSSEESVQTDAAIHRFDRDPAEVAHAWRRKLDDSDFALLEDMTGPMLGQLEASKLPLLES